MFFFLNWKKKGDDKRKESKREKNIDPRIYEIKCFMKGKIVRPITKSIDNTPHLLKEIKIRKLLLNAFTY